MKIIEHNPSIGKEAILHHEMPLFLDALCVKKISQQG